MEIGSLLGKVVDLVSDAGKILIDNYPNLLRIETKADGTFVTQVDRESSRSISAGLRLISPGFAILDEETKEDGSRFDSGFCWVVDPLDDTKGYINGGKNFGVMVGLLHEFVPVMGICYKPSSNELSYAVKEKGAYININGVTSRLRVSGSSSLDRVLVSDSRKSPDLDRMLNLLNPVEIIHMGGSLKTIEVAKGNSEVFLCPPSSTMHLWDLCAPQVILEEAGGRMTDVYGKEFDYSQRETANRNGIIAANNDNIYKTVLNLLRN